MSNEETIEQIKQWKGPTVQGEELGFWSREVPGGEAYGYDAILVTHIYTNRDMLCDSYQVVATEDSLRVLTRNREGAAYPALQTFPLTPDRDEFLAAVRMFTAISN